MPKHGGGQLNNGNPGKKGGGRPSLEYKRWLAGCLDSDRHRQTFETYLTNANREFVGATKLAIETAHGKPTQTVDLNAKVTVLWDL